jgi:ADP-Ribosyltransferase in polyvalent proteins
MKLWHGSDRRFDEFDMSKIGTGDGKSIGGWGIYFSDRRQVADRYALRKGQLDLWDVEVRPGKMFDFDSYDPDQYNKISSKIDSEEFATEYEDCNGKQIYDWLSFDRGGEREASEFLQSIGYDGVVMRDKWDADATNYIMFSAARIRGKVDEDGEMYEDGESPGPGYATLDSVPGMGAPIFPSRTSTGSGDVPSPPARVKRFKEFKKLKRGKKK